jgi:hypothetical protein
MQDHSFWLVYGLILRPTVIIIVYDPAHRSLISLRINIAQS